MFFPYISHYKPASESLGRQPYMGMYCPVTIFYPQTGFSLQRPVFQPALVLIIGAKTISGAVFDS